MTTTSTLHELAERGNHARIIRILEREIDVDINEKDQYGRTPLQWAAEHDHVRTIESLIDMGASLHACDNMGRTAIHLAARSGAVDALEALISQSTETEISELVNVTDHKGITPAFLAKQKESQGEEAFHFLLKHGAIYNYQTDLHRRSSSSSEDDAIGLSSQKNTQSSTMSPQNGNQECTNEDKSSSHKSDNT